MEYFNGQCTVLKMNVRTKIIYNNMDEFYQPKAKDKRQKQINAV